MGTFTLSLVILSLVLLAYFARRQIVISAQLRNLEDAIAQREALSVAAWRTREDFAVSQAESRERAAEQEAEARDRRTQQAIIAYFDSLPLQRAVILARRALVSYQETIGLPVGLGPNLDNIPLPDAVRIWLDRAPDLLEECSDENMKAAIQALQTAINEIRLPQGASNASRRGAMMMMNEAGHAALDHASLLLRSVRSIAPPLPETIDR